MKVTNFDLYPEERLKEPTFARRFDQAGEAWDVALQIAALRERAGLSQKELARKLKTSQQNISRLESPSYEGHSLTMLRRVAKALSAPGRVVFEAENEAASSHLAKSPVPYQVKRRSVDSLSSKATTPSPNTSVPTSRIRLTPYEHTT